jgi:hypothetical protein
MSTSSPTRGTNGVVICSYSITLASVCVDLDHEAPSPCRWSLFTLVAGSAATQDPSDRVGGVGRPRRSATMVVPLMATIAVCQELRALAHVEQLRPNARGLLDDTECSAAVGQRGDRNPGRVDVDAVLVSLPADLLSVGRWQS